MKSTWGTEAGLEGQIIKVASPGLTASDHLPPNTYQTPTEHLLNIYQPPTDHLPTTYHPPTNHLPTTYWPPTIHLPSTYQVPTNHLPSTYLPTTYQPSTIHLPSTYQLPTNRLSNTFQPGTKHLPNTAYGAACSIFPFLLLPAMEFMLLLDQNFYKFCSISQTAGQLSPAAW